MDVAIDRTGVRVRASNAHRGGDYICPECRIRVIYAAGRLQVPHFRHSPRTPAERDRVENCSLYAADQLGGNGGGVRYTQTAPEPPRPRLAFAWAGKDPSNQRWALLVTIPPPPTSASYVHVEENLNGGVDVPRDVVRARRSVWVKARSIQYQVLGYDKSRHPVWRPEPTDLFRSDLPNLFEAGANGGAQLGPDAPAVRGSSYLAIMRRGAYKSPPAKPSRPVYRLEACDPRGEWDSFLVYVPARGEQEIEHWVRSVCARDIVDPPPRLDLVSPPFRALGPDGVYDIDSGTEVVLAIRGGDWQAPLLELVDEEAGTSIGWPVEPSEGGFISMGALPIGRFAVHLREWECVTLRLAPAAAVLPVVAGVTLRSAPLDAGPDFETPLLSGGAAERWGNIISGREILRGIDAPECWPISLSWCAADEDSGSVSDMIISSSLSRELADCMASDPLSATLDAGAFGRVEWRRPAALTESEAIARSLPADISARLSWLLIARWSVTGPKLPLGLPVPHNWQGCIHPSDTPLVAGFLGSPGWPLALLPLARSVGRDLAILFEM